MNNQNLGNFPINALDGAVDRITKSVADARNQIEKLVEIESKTYMNFVRPLMDIDAALDNQTSPIGHLDGVKQQR